MLRTMMSLAVLAFDLSFALVAFGRVDAMQASRAAYDGPPGITGRLWFFNNTRESIGVRVEGEKVRGVEFDLKPGGTWKVSTVEKPPTFMIGYTIPAPPVHPMLWIRVVPCYTDYCCVFRYTKNGLVEAYVFRPTDY